jgi:hypothetical protein
MNTTTPPPGDPAWAHVRARYEQDQETVAAIAADVGLTSIALAMIAKKEGWKLRGKARLAPAAAAKPKGESTAATIKRLKDILQSRLTQLETEIKELGEDVDKLTSERQIRATHVLVRTIEKVMDLERKDRLRKRKAAFAFRYFDRQQREQLADKIDRLGREWAGQVPVTEAAAQGSGGAEPPVAVLGAAGKPAAPGV